MTELARPVEKRENHPFSAFRSPNSKGQRRKPYHRFHLPPFPTKLLPSPKGSCCGTDQAFQAPPHNLERGGLGRGTLFGERCHHMSLLSPANTPQASIHQSRVQSVWNSTTVSSKKNMKVFKSRITSSIPRGFSWSFGRAAEYCAERLP